MDECNYCGMIHGKQCPSVKAIEYFKDGTVKRVEFMTSKDYAQFPAQEKFPLPPWPVTSYGG